MPQLRAMPPIPDTVLILHILRIGKFALKALSFVDLFQ